VLVTAAVIGMIAHRFATLPGPAAIVIGSGLALSSTAVVLQVRTIIDNHPVYRILLVFIKSQKDQNRNEVVQQFHSGSCHSSNLLFRPRLGLLKHVDLSNVIVECFLSSYLSAFFKNLAESFLGLLLSTCCFFFNFA
jgi:hypothetical protein